MKTFTLIAAFAALLAAGSFAASFKPLLACEKCKGR